MKIQLTHKFEDIISLENLLAARQEFLCGKRRRLDVQIFCWSQMSENGRKYRRLLVRIRLLFFLSFFRLFSYNKRELIKKYDKQRKK